MYFTHGFVSGDHARAGVSCDGVTSLKFLVLFACGCKPVCAECGANGQVHQPRSQARSSLREPGNEVAN